MGCLTTLQWKLGEIEMNKAYLGLGTNMGNRENYLRKAVEIINNNQEKKDIIIVSEMILAYKIAARYKDNIIIRYSKCYFKK